MRDRVKRTMVPCRGGLVAREDLYHRYSEFANAQGLEVIKPCAFGRLVKGVYPGVRPQLICFTSFSGPDSPHVLPSLWLGDVTEGSLPEDRFAGPQQDALSGHEARRPTLNPAHHVPSSRCLPHSRSSPLGAASGADVDRRCASSSPSDRSLPQSSLMIELRLKCSYLRRRPN